jgi:hypothetical protein
MTNDEGMTNDETITIALGNRYFDARRRLV